ncbi:hypothetical protein [Oceanospirillum linum]|nr:hypothetical protein [Oceanospirillum linum]SEG02307.1 hypothetical protein SAMN04489856_104133 [Oleiphilus messinensis]SMP21611.1 hypothetical protein SAMN06264348_104125 [Oceanospirillum linum]
MMKQKKPAAKAEVVCRNKKQMQDAGGEIPCRVCLTQGAPCAAMTQQLFSGKAELVECELIKHHF